MLTANETAAIAEASVNYCDSHHITRPSARRQVYNEMLFMLVLLKRGMTNEQVIALSRLDDNETERILSEFPRIQ